MATVTIDIPGIGNVEAKNAATEATLLEILRVMKSQKGGGGSGSGSGSKTGKDQEKEDKESLKNAKEHNKQAPLANRAATALAGSFKMLGTSVTSVGAGLLGLGEAVTQTIEQFANVGDSVQNAAKIFSGIPLIGTVFSAVATAATKVTDSFQKASASGATFGGSITQFSKAASAAGMTMENYGALIAKNGESMRLLGGTTEGGAKRFGDISKTLRSTSSDLYALGYSTEDVNQGLASYSKFLGQTGKIGGKSNAELAAGAKNYLKEMDMLAKVTGESRKDQEAAREKLLSDAQYQAAVSSMSAEEAEKFANSINGLPKGLRDVAKDIMVTGTATTEESQQFAALMPKSAEKMAEFAEMSKRGIAPTLQQQQELQNLLKMEGEGAKKQYGDNARYNKDIAKTYGMINDAANINKDGLKQANAEQKDAAKTTDGLAAAMEKSKQTLAEFSNGFQMALAQSGILDTMLKAFSFLANIVQTVLVPIFTNYLVPAITFLGALLFDTIIPVFTDIASYLADKLQPIFSDIGDLISNTLYPAFLDMVVFVQSELLPVFQDIAAAIGEMVTPIFNALGAVIKDYVWPAFQAIGSFISNNLTPIMATLLTALTAYATYQLITGIGALIAFGGSLIAATLPFLPLIAAVGLIAAGFFFLYKKLEEMGYGFNMLGDGLRMVGIKFKEFMGAVGDMISKIPGMGRSKEEQKARDEEKIALEKEKGEILERLDAKKKANLEAQTEEGKAAKAAEKAEKRQQLEENIDKKIIDAKKKAAAAKGGAGDKKDDKKESKPGEAKKDEIDMSSPTATLLSFAKQQNSGLVKPADKTPEDLSKMTAAEKDAYLKKKAAEKEAATAAPTNPSPSGTARAEAPKNEIEAQKAAAAKELEEAKKKKAEEDAKRNGSGSSPNGKEKTQESAETLLASLNTKMDQLIMVNRKTHEVNERQLTVQTGLSGDVFNIA